MRLATFNIYWLGDDTKLDSPRTDDDYRTIAQVIAGLDADVIAFQEIVDVARLEALLAAAGAATGRHYTVRDTANRLLGYAGQSQKTAIAYDANRWQLAAAATVTGGKGRLPFAVRVRSTQNGVEVVIVGVHFQSGYPDLLDKDDAEVRKQQARHLAHWLTGKLPDAAGPLAPPGEDEIAVVLGDCNALRASPRPDFKVLVASLAPLRTGAMKAWSWLDAVADPLGGGQATAYAEKLLIDHVILSPAAVARITIPPTIYAFDLPQRLGKGGERVSDHRPVFVELGLH